MEKLQYGKRANEKGQKKDQAYREKGRKCCSNYAGGIRCLCGGSLRVHVQFAGQKHAAEDLYERYEHACKGA